MTIDRFWMVGTVEGVQLLMRRHVADVGPTKVGQVLPAICRKVEEMMRTGDVKQYPAIDYSLLGDPCDDITEHWARTLCMSVHERGAASKADLDRAVRWCWPAYARAWRVMVDYWTNPVLED